MPALTLFELIKKRAELSPDSDAIVAPGRTALSFSNLISLLSRTGSQLSELGLQPNDRIAVVLPNGPEMATTFLATACSYCSAPLNPNYQEPEFEFYLQDLDAKLVVVESGTNNSIRSVASRMNIPMLEVTSDYDTPAGTFSFDDNQNRQTTERDEIKSDDLALMLHTSGTTSRPKMVPLNHANICTSANNIVETLRLSDSDRCLNVMPLFHIHGLIASLVASLAAGGSVICAPGYNKEDFFTWIREFKPTWYTAVPTIHQSILSAAASQQKTIELTPLRFIRSSSAALAPNTKRELEDAFNTPVIEAYGMTEAAHQMASNPLPPAPSKVRSVGPAAGPEIAIMDSTGNFLEPGEVGEIVIRGTNVTSGYQENSQANAEAFINGWFRTGDQGYLDEDAYLFLTGRLKEIINRGGENISPREIDEALMEHPEIEVAVGFSVPHPTLGEDVAAAVILTSESTLTAQDVRSFAFERLADFKVPSQVLIVNEIPKGPTGKLQRIGLTEKFTVLLEGKYSKPETDLEELVADTICEVLKRDKVGAEDNFFRIGGDSLTATQVIARLNEIFHAEIPIATLFRRPTARDLASEISNNVEVEDPELLEQLLKELEDMPDSEVQALLDRELKGE